MRILLVSLLLLAGCTPSPQPELTAEQVEALDRAAEWLGEDPDANAQDWVRPGLHTWPEGLEMPSDVEDFIVQWESCQHALSEPFSDEQRRRMLERMVRETCPGVDAHGRRIRARYAGNGRIIAALRDFEPLGQ
jgi:hypothetical protein